MHILNIEPAAFEGPGFRELARFDVQVTDQIRLFRMRLIEAPSGRRLTYAPSYGRQRLASFAPALSDQITALAVAALKNMEREKTHDCRTAA